MRRFEPCRPLRSDIVFAGGGARFGHPEQSLGIVMMLGGIQRIAERAGKVFAMEWALTVSRVVADDKLVDDAGQFGGKPAQRPTRAHSVHKALLMTWSAGGVTAADDGLIDLALPLFDTEDMFSAPPAAAVEAFKAGLPRPNFAFKGR